MGAPENEPGPIERAAWKTLGALGLLALSLLALFCAGGALIVVVDGGMGASGGGRHGLALRGRLLIALRFAGAALGACLLMPALWRSIGDAGVRTHLDPSGR